MYFVKISCPTFFLLLLFHHNNNLAEQTTRYEWCEQSFVCVVWVIAVLEELNVIQSHWGVVVTGGGDGEVGCNLSKK